MTHQRTSLGLYIHIPFCKQKCVYCDFYSLAGSEARMDAYTAALRRHLEHAAPSAAGYAVDTVYFGGGTPSYLGPERLTAILDTVFQHYSVTPGAEITLEANPDSAGDPAALRQLRSAGFNRISLGMQSACDEELRTIGRVHTMEQVRQAVDAARTAGFENLSLDLIYGLPGQTPDRWAANLATAVALTPEHLSCYGLKVEEGTPLFARRKEFVFPDDEAQADLYLYTVDALAQAGYHQYEISNFSRPGRESRHNLKYWTLGEYLGFGPGAHSDFRGRRFALDPSLDRHLASSGDPEALLSEQETPSPAERTRERLMLGLRTVAGLDPAEFQRCSHGNFAPLLPFLDQCRQAGYAVLDSDRWHLTPQGFLLSNQIIGELLDRLPPERE